MMFVVVWGCVGVCGDVWRCLGDGRAAAGLQQGGGTAAAGLRSGASRELVGSQSEASRETAKRYQGLLKRVFSR
jgi:hypothetical protein